MPMGSTTGGARSSESEGSSPPSIEASGAPERSCGARPRRRAACGTPPEAGGGPRRPEREKAPSTVWWKQVDDLCPISGFPVKLLPYPPFKLQADPRTVGTGTHLVDGFFLVVKAIAELSFQALGKSLTKLDIEALDQYTRRCRLGRFRLGEVIRLHSNGGEAALKELENIREQARRKLISLKQIKRIRLARLAAA
mmetsp:Transcript_150477/g.464301  ORF Transcript_150477/g.464301 Transcript_150477/m.464301 type:complete len:196 (+) Transcript_150477:527-1114(+)